MTMSTSIAHASCSQIFTATCAAVELVRTYRSAYCTIARALTAHRACVLIWRPLARIPPRFPSHPLHCRRASFSARRGVALDNAAFTRDVVV